MISEKGLTSRQMKYVVDHLSSEGPSDGSLRTVAILFPEVVMSVLANPFNSTGKIALGQGPRGKEAREEMLRLARIVDTQMNLGEEKIIEPQQPEPDPNPSPDGLHYEGKCPYPVESDATPMACPSFWRGHEH